MHTQVTCKKVVKPSMDTAVTTQLHAEFACSYCLIQHLQKVVHLEVHVLFNAASNNKAEYVDLRRPSLSIGSCAVAQQLGST